MFMYKAMAPALGLFKVINNCFYDRSSNFARSMILFDYIEVFMGNCFPGTAPKFYGLSQAWIANRRPAAVLGCGYREEKNIALKFPFANNKTAGY